MKDKKFQFSKKAQSAIDLIEKTNQNLFITGKAGTGKSTLLEHIRNNASKKTVVLAPTGIAAINVNGDTIHSFFTLKPGFEKEEAKKMHLDDQKASKYKSIKTIAIDEISMVRADLLDAVDIFLRRARKNQAPFGGVQMIFFGDLYQLPPVVTNVDAEKFYSEYDAPYFFAAQVFHGQKDLFGGHFNLKLIELDEIYRQSDLEFIEILNAVRENNIQPQHLEKLNTRWQPKFVAPDDDTYIYLMTTNAAAEAINLRQLDKLNQERIYFNAEIKGDVPRNLYPNSEEIILSIGAQVMFICNDAERRWVNGTIGKILDIRDEIDEETQEEYEIIEVEKADGETVEVKQHIWEISRYAYHRGSFEREMIGSFKQMPLKLAWAITIHKSQGKTFDKVVIDLGRGSFAHGQTYVALSRCTSLEGIVLKKPISVSSIIMDKRVEQIFLLY